MSIPLAPSLLHGSAAAIMAYGFLALHSLPVNDFIITQKGGHFQYLTIQGLAVAWLTMIVSLVCDVLPTGNGARVVKRTLLMIALPLAFVISSIYWTLLLLFPSLILQKMSTEQEPSSEAVPELLRIPLNVDLALHASPLISLLIDFFAFEKRYPAKHVKGVAPLVVLVSTIWYASWAEYCATFNGSFPYPFLTENDFNGRVIIYVSVAALAYACFCGINALKRV